MKQFLRDIITQAGNIALEYRKKVHSLTVDQKQSKELVCEADYAIDQFLIAEIKNRYPDLRPCYRIVGGPYAEEDNEYKKCWNR